MKFLITGGTGFLGRHLTPYLKNQGHEITIINTKNCDLTEKSNLLKFKNQKFDKIYHLACWTKAGDFCVHHKGQQWLINQEINTNILRYWYDYQKDIPIIVMGTSCSYSPELIKLKEENYMSGEPDKDFYTYAMTKRMLYEALRAFNNQFQMDFYHLIPSTLYGPNFDKKEDSHFIFDLIKKITKGKKQNKEVSLWGTGEQIRELIYINDVLRLIDIITSNDNNKNESFNIGSGIGYSIKEYAKMICEIIDYDPKKIKYDTTKFSGVSKKVLNVEKINKLSKNNFQFTPIMEGLKQTIDYYEQM